MMIGTKGMKMPRGDKKHIHNYIVPIPPLAKQKQIVSKVLAFEAEISKAKADKELMASRKQSIFRRFGVVV